MKRSSVRSRLAPPKISRFPTDRLGYNYKNYSCKNIAFIAAAIWMLVAMVIAVRQALDYKSTWRAVGVVVTAFLIQSIILFMILKIFNITPGQ